MNPHTAGAECILEWRGRDMILNASLLINCITIDQGFALVNTFNFFTDTKLVRNNRLSNLPVFKLYVHKDHIFRQRNGF
jgi:hypothetical protein